MTKFYCECCEVHRSVQIERALMDDKNEMFWGDIVCEECHFVIATYSEDRQGMLMFVPDDA